MIGFTPNNPRDADGTRMSEHVESLMRAYAGCTIPGAMYRELFGWGENDWSPERFAQTPPEVLLGLDYSVDRLAMEGCEQ